MDSHSSRVMRKGTIFSGRLVRASRSVSTTSAPQKLQKLVNIIMVMKKQKEAYLIKIS